MIAEKKLACHKIRGFSLTELAIVLGIIGGILAGLWQIVNIVWENTHREQLYEATVITIQNMRQLYSGRLTMDTSVTKASLIPKLIQQNVIPSYLVRNSADTSCATTATPPACADTPFGYSNPNDSEGPVYGTFQVCAWDPANTNCDTNTVGTSFGIRLLELDAGTCAQIINKLAGSGGPSGLLAVNVNSGILGLPVTAAAAVNACQSSALMPAGNTVSFIYRLDAAQ